MLERGEVTVMRGNFPPGVGALDIPGNEAPTVVACGQCGANIDDDKAVYCDFEGITMEAFCDRQCFAEWIGENADTVAEYLMR